MLHLHKVRSKSQIHRGMEKVQYGDPEVQMKLQTCIEYLSLRQNVFELGNWSNEHPLDL